MSEDPVLFLRGVTDPDAEDVWDDTLLIRMWDKSLEDVKKGILNGLSEDQNEKSDELNAREQEKTIPSNGKPATSSLVEEVDLTNRGSVSDSEHGSNKTKQKKYHVGQHVRAPYSVDGQDYEGIVVRVMPWKASCIVKFVGYGNKEEVFLSDLKKSHGTQAVQNQIDQAKMESVEEDSDVFEGQENKMELEHEHPRVPIANKTETKNINSGLQSTVNSQIQMGKYRNKAHSSFRPTLPPQSQIHYPIVSTIAPPALNTLSHQTHSEHEAFNSMMMSWYLNGYHTGYYEGLKHGKEMAKASIQRPHYYEHKK